MLLQNLDVPSTSSDWRKCWQMGRNATRSRSAIKYSAKESKWSKCCMKFRRSETQKQVTFSLDRRRHLSIVIHDFTRRGFDIDSRENGEVREMEKSSLRHTSENIAMFFRVDLLLKSRMVSREAMQPRVYHQRPSKWEFDRDLKTNLVFSII